MPKLTLSADQETIDRAKRLAAQQGTSVSEMFRAFVRSLHAGPNDNTEAVGPITRQLTGILDAPPDRSNRELIQDALAERYLK